MPSEYARYGAKLRRNPRLSFYYAGSLEYEGSEQLVSLGLLKEDQKWKRIRAAAHASAPSAARNSFCSRTQ